MKRNSNDLSDGLGIGQRLDIVTYLVLLNLAIPEENTS